MTKPRRKREVFANPFFNLMMIGTLAFVLTVLAYLVSPFALERAEGQGAQGRRSIALAEWLDRNAPMTLAVEFIVMLASGVTAMATDHYFSSRSRSKPPA
jgi:hypothetical protein